MPKCNPSLSSPTKEKKKEKSKKKNMGKIWLQKQKSIDCQKS